MADNAINPWTVRSREVMYDNRWIRVTHNDVLTPAKTPGVYGTVHFKNRAIGIVPVDADGHTFLVGQYRFPIEQYSWEIPEGGSPLDVDPKASAMRELREETGLSARQWARLGEFYVSNCVSDELAILFMAWDMTAGEAMPEPTEQLEVRRLHLKDAFAMVESGAIKDGMSVVALQAVQLLYLQKRLPFAHSW
jgi:8-oxo-dGTP pyrophosphatase MutT (NUDIX family)